MPQPTRGQVHINAPLTNISVAYLQSDDVFAARKLFPAIPVQKQSDYYFKYPKGQWFRDEMAERAPGTESQGSGYTVESDLYGCRVFALHRDIADQVRDNADDPINLDKEATQFLTAKWLISQERRFIAAYFQPSIWTGTSDGLDVTLANKWSTDDGDPVYDVEQLMDAMQAKTGFRPNKLSVVPAVNTALKHHPSIKDRVKYTQRASITEEMLAQLFGVEEYIVMRAVYNASAEGASDSMNYIAGSDGALLTYAPKSAGLMTPSAGYIFDWVGHVGSGAQGQRIKQFRMEQLASDRTEIEAAYDMKQVAADLGAFIPDCL